MEEVGWKSLLSGIRQIKKRMKRNNKMDGVSPHSSGLHPMVTTDLMMPFGDWFGVKSKAAAARGANTCRTGRNSVHLSIKAGWKRIKL